MVALLPLRTRIQPGHSVVNPCRLKSLTLSLTSWLYFSSSSSSLGGSPSSSVIMGPSYCMACSVLHPLGVAFRLSTIASSHLSSSGLLRMAQAFTMPSLFPTSTSLELLQCPSQRPSSHLDSIAFLGPLSVLFLYQTFPKWDYFDVARFAGLSLVCSSSVFADLEPRHRHSRPSH